MGMRQIVDFVLGTDVFHLNPDFFPTTTRELIPVETILRWGILPLGIKHKTKWFQRKDFLNVGVLNHRTPGIYSEVERLGKNALGDRYGGFQLFRLQGPEFLNVLESVYGCSRAGIVGKTGVSEDLKRLISG